MALPEKDTRRIILVIDDEESVLKLMKTRLELEGFQVVTSAEGLQAIDAIHQLTPEQRHQIAAVLLDIGLKDVPGENVLKSLKKILPELPVIMVTGLHDESKARELVKLGALDYITKPVNFQQLIETLQNIASD